MASSKNLGSVYRTKPYSPGDIVSRRKGLVMHKGIVLNDGSVYHNTPLRGEHVSSVEEFRKNKRVFVHSLEPHNRAKAICAYEESEARRYNPFRNNCEHTVSRAVTGEGRSPQLFSLLVSGGVAAATLAVTRSWPLAVAGFALTKRLTSKNDLV